MADGGESRRQPAGQPDVPGSAVLGRTDLDPAQTCRCTVRSGRCPHRASVCSSPTVSPGRSPASPESSTVTRMRESSFSAAFTSRRVLVVVEAEGEVGTFSNSTSTGSRRACQPLRHLQHLRDEGEDVVDRLRVLLGELRLQRHHVCVADFIEPLLAERWWPDVLPVDRLLRVQRAALLAVRLAVIDEHRLEGFDGGHILSHHRVFLFAPPLQLVLLVVLRPASVAASEPCGDRIRFLGSRFPSG